jgi:hypothetical protein
MTAANRHNRGWLLVSASDSRRAVLYWAFLLILTMDEPGSYCRNTSAATAFLGDFLI